MFPFAQSDSQTFPVLSVYLQKGPALKAQLTDVLKPIKEEEFDHAQAMSLRTDMEKIADLRLSQETSPAVGIFACEGEGWFHIERLPRAVPDFATIGRRPYLRPIRTLPRTTRTAAAIVERRTASIWLIEGGAISRAGDIEVDETNKKNYGGWHGYAERRARGHSDELLQRHYRDTSEVLFAMHQADPFDYLAIGHHADTRDFMPTLHPYLQHLVAGEFVVDPHTLTPTEILGHTSKLEAEAERHRRVSMVDAFVETRAGNRKAALGLAEMIDATNVRAVHSMLVAPEPPMEGAICDECGWIARMAGECQACGSDMRGVCDVVDEIIEAVIRDGGSVEGIGPDTVLDGHAVGGALRFPVR